MTVPAPLPGGPAVTFDDAAALRLVAALRDLQADLDAFGDLERVGWAYAIEGWTGAARRDYRDRHLDARSTLADARSWVDDTIEAVLAAAQRAANDQVRLNEHERRGREAELDRLADLAEQGS